MLIHDGEKKRSSTQPSAAIGPPTSGPRPPVPLWRLRVSNSSLRIRGPLKRRFGRLIGLRFIGLFD